MPFLDCFTDVRTIPALIKRESGTFANGRVTNSFETVATENVIFYLGGQSESVIAERIKENVDATAIFLPSADVRERDQITINSKKYSAVYVDDVGLQGEAKVVALGLIK